jgi:hypothetical protein
LTMWTNSNMAKKQDAVAALFRITKNAYSKKFRVERNYKEETTDGEFVDCWYDVRGPYTKLSDAQSAKTSEVESVKADQAKWVPVA